MVFQQIFFPAPMGIVLNGALVGGRIALIALGIALVYRANRIVNFAQGDLGAVPAVLGVMLVVAWGWSYWFGLVVGLLAAVLLGVLVEGLIIRRFFTAPRLLLTVATIGLAQLLTGAGLFLPRAFGDQSFGTRLPQPFDASFVFGGVTFNANDIFTMIVVPVCLLALALFLQRSTIGIAIVGAAERADRAFTLGIPVKRLHTVVWVVASVLAFLAMFLRAGAVGLPIGETLAPVFLVQALAAAVFGRFERFTTIAAAAIGLGIVDQSMTFQSGNKEAYNVAVLFGIVLVGLLVTRRGTGTGRVDSDASATWQATREMRPIPREMRRLPEVIWGRIGLLAIVALFVGRCRCGCRPASSTWRRSSRSSASWPPRWSSSAAGRARSASARWRSSAWAPSSAARSTDHRNWDLALAMLVAGLVGGVAAVIVGYPALRRRGLTLAVSTLAFGLFVSEFLLNRTIPFLRDRLPGRRIDRGTLLGIELSSEQAMFYACLAVLVLGLIMVVGVRRSRTGRVLIAIRENEKAARAYGVNATRTSLAAFALSGFLAAVAGALYVHQQTGLSAEPFSVAGQPRAVHDGGDRRPRLPAGRAARRHLRPLGRLLPASRVAVPGHRRGAAARAARVPERVRRRARRPAGRRAAQDRHPAGDGGAQPPRRRAGRGGGRRAARGDGAGRGRRDRRAGRGRGGRDADGRDRRDRGREPGEPDGSGGRPDRRWHGPPPVDAARSNNGATGGRRRRSGAGDDTVEEVHQ